MQRGIVLSASDIYDRSRALFEVPAKVFGGSPQILHLNYVHAQVGGRCDDSFKALVIVPGLREIVMDGEAGLELASCCLLLGKSDDLLFDFFHSGLFFGTKGHAELAASGRDSKVACAHAYAGDGAKEHAVRLVPGQFFGLQDDPRDCAGWISPLFRSAGVGGLALKADPQAFGCRLRESGSIDNTSFRIAAQVVKCIDLRDALLTDQLPADHCTAAGLLPRLEDEVDVRICIFFFSVEFQGIVFFSVEFQGKSAQRCAMAVMPAFVGDAFIP